MSLWRDKQQARAAEVPPWLLTVLAMLSVQLSGAFAVGLSNDVGPRGAAWLRVAAGAVLILAIARPRLRGVTWRDAGLVTALGVTTGSLTFFFLPQSSASNSAPPWLWNSSAHSSLPRSQAPRGAPFPIPPSP